MSYYNSENIDPGEVIPQEEQDYTDDVFGDDDEECFCGKCIFCLPGA